MNEFVEHVVNCQITLYCSLVQTMYSLSEAARSDVPQHHPAFAIEEVVATSCLLIVFAHI